MIKRLLKRVPSKLAHVLITSLSGTIIHQTLNLYPAPLSLITVVTSAVLCLFSTSAPYIAVLASVVFPLSQMSYELAVIAVAAILLTFALLGSWSLVVVLLALVSLTILEGSLDVVSMACLLAVSSLIHPSRALALTILYSIAVISSNIALSISQLSSYKCVALYIIPTPSKSLLSQVNASVAPMELLSATSSAELVEVIAGTMSRNIILIMNQVLFTAIAGYVASKSVSISRFMWRGIVAGALSSTLLSFGSAMVMYMTVGYYLDLSYYAFFIILTTLLTYIVERVGFLIEKYNNILTVPEGVEEMEVSFSEIGGLEQVKAFIKDSIMLPLLRKEVARKYSLELPRGVLIFGPPGCGKSMLLMALHSSVRDNSMYVRCGEYFVESREWVADKLRKLFSMAKRYAPFIVLLDDVERIARGELGRILAHELEGLEGFDIIVIAATDVPHEINPELLKPGKFEKLIYIPLPNKEERLEIFRIHTRNMPLAPDVNLEKLAEMCKRFSGADIVAVCREAALVAARESLVKKKHVLVRMEDFVNVIENSRPSITFEMLREYEKFKEKYKHLIALPTKVRVRSLTWDNVVDMEDIKRELIECIEVPLAYPELFEKYGIKSSLKGVLLFGPRGCGKTLLSRTLGNQIDATFIEVACASLIKSEDPSTELRKAFERAIEKAPSLILLDNVELIAPKEIKDRRENKLLSTLISEMERLAERDYKVIVLATTNRPLHLNSSILGPGKFERFIYIPPPNKRLRKELFIRHLSKVKLSSDVNFEALAEMTERCSSLDIIRICEKAKIRLAELEARGRSATLTMEDLKEIITNHKRLITKEEIVECIEFMIKIRGEGFD